MNNAVAMIFVTVAWVIFLAGMLIVAIRDVITDVRNEMQRLKLDHTMALIREEEKGFARGVEQGRLYFESELAKIKLAKVEPQSVLIAKNARLTEQMNDLRSAFYVNMLRCYPTKTHQEISDAIEAATTGRVAAKPGHLTEHHDSASM
jgi:hypothetical protein